MNKSEIKAAITKHQTELLSLYRQYYIASSVEQTESGCTRIEGCVCGGDTEPVRES